MICESINGVSNQEYTEILGTFISLTNREYDCNKCIEASKRKKNGDNIRKLKGCFEKQPHSVYTYKRRVNFFRCPANFKNFEIAKIMRDIVNSPKLTFIERQSMSSKLVETITLLENLIEEKRQDDDKRSSGNIKR